MLGQSQEGPAHVSEGAVGFGTLIASAIVSDFAGPVGGWRTAAYL